MCCFSAALITAYFTLGKKETKAAETESVQKRDISSTVSLNASIMPETTISATSLLGGRVKSVNVKAGDSVKEGQLLFTIEDAAVEKEYQAAKEEYDALDLSSAVFSDSNANAQSIKKLMAMAQLIGMDYEEFNSAFEGKEVSSFSDMDYVSAVTQRYELAKAKHDEMQIFAKASGHVISVNIQEGAAISAGAPAVVIASENGKVVYANVFESDAKNIKEGQSVTIKANNKKYSGVVDTVSLISSSSKEAGAIRSGEVIVDPLSDIDAMFGQSSEIIIVTGKQNNALSISLSAVNSEGYVYVEEGDAFVKRKVETGIRNDKYVHIVSGLKEGDVVVTDAFGFGEEE